MSFVQLVDSATTSEAASTANFQPCKRAELRGISTEATPVEQLRLPHIVSLPSISMYTRSAVSLLLPTVCKSWGTSPKVLEAGAKDPEHKNRALLSAAIVLEPYRQRKGCNIRQWILLHWTRQLTLGVWSPGAENSSRGSTPSDAISNAQLVLLRHLCILPKRSQ